MYCKIFLHIYKRVCIIRVFISLFENVMIYYLGIGHKLKMLTNFEEM